MRVHLKKLALSLMLVGVYGGALAGQADDLACDLAKSTAAVQADILKAPKAFMSVGSSEVQAKSAVLGVSQSLSNMKKAAYVEQAAHVNCEVMNASAALDQYALFAESSVALAGAEAKVKKVMEAIKLAEDDLKVLEKQLASNVITVQEFTAASRQLANLLQVKAELMAVIAQPTLPTPSLSMTAVADRLTASTALFNNLSAKAQAQSGWDVSVSAGMRQRLDSEITGAKSQAFVAISANWSFGYEGAVRNAEKVGQLTAVYLALDPTGATQKITRHKEKLAKLVEAEKIVVDAATSQAAKLRQIIENISVIKSDLAQNSIRTLSIELMLATAELESAQAKIVRLSDLLATL